MSCAHVVDQMSELMDGTLDAQCPAEVQAHLNRCSNCTAFLRTYESVPLLLRAADLSGIRQQSRSETRD